MWAGWLGIVLAASAAEVIRGPYLQTGTPHSVVVCWRTDEATDSRVIYGTSATNLTLAAMVEESVINHEVVLTNLTPNTRYFYAIGTATEQLAGGTNYYFRTAPLGRKATRIWVLGDSGTANADAAAVRDAYVQFANGRYTDLWLMLGDNAYYSGTDEEHQRAVFDMYPEMLRKSVLWPTIGNHETYADFPYPNIFRLPTAGEAGGVPSGTEEYYSFNYANIHFVCLNSMASDRSDTGPMASWLKADLADNTQDWLIAFWHHPPYSKGSHNSDTEVELVQMRENILPILEANGVDLVLSGHSHGYERSYLLNGHYGKSGTFDKNTMAKDAGDGRLNGTGAYSKAESGLSDNSGTVYVVAGSSGMTTYGPLNHPAMFVSFLELGSLVLDIDGDQLNAQFLQANQATSDYFTIVKGTNNPIQILTYQVTTGNVTVSWNSLPNKRYLVESRPAFMTPDWRAVSSPITASGTRTTWTGLRPASTNAFYRVVNVPSDPGESSD